MVVLWDLVFLLVLLRFPLSSGTYVRGVSKGVSERCLVIV